MAKGSSDSAYGDIERAGRLVSYAEEFEDRWFWETDPDGRLSYLSSSVAQQIEAFGLPTIGAPLSRVFRIDQSEFEQSRSLQFHLTSRTAFSGYPVRGQKGLHESWWSMSGRPRFDAHGKFQGFVGSGTDLTMIRKHEATIERLALSDSLTGLANRQRMRDTLELSLKDTPVDSQSIALILLDLDGFKAVNDTLGHPLGDALLIQVAQRLVRVVGEEGIVGRLGGDEFEIIVPYGNSSERLSRVAEEIIRNISEPYLIHDNPINVSCSVGIATTHDSGTSVEKLVRNADLALYAAKANGRAKYRFFDHKMLLKAQWRKQTEDDLRLALHSDQLSLVYQPVVSTMTERLSGFEALLRWEHPTRGAIGPAEFIPIAEESGLIQQIGEWVLRTATRDLATLPEDLRIAVNVSAIQFASPSLPGTLASSIAESQIDPARLELEITESVFLEDEAASARMFNALKSLGVRLALDDFGTGYSSLGYLKSAPFDKIKIDQSFVRGAIDSRNRNAAIIEAIVALSKTLGMETTAEGVEYQDEIGLIKKLGCSHIQGFVYGQGRKINDLLPKLKSGIRRVRATGHQYSRSPRAKLLRLSTMRVNGSERDIRIRNISSTGALIDQIDFTDQIVGVDVLVGILENELTLAKVRRVGDQGVGIEFHEPIAPEALETASNGSVNAT